MARALLGGWHAWLAANMPVEPKFTAVDAQER